MIQFAEKKHQTALMEMWKTCFSDSDRFIRFYFNNIYREEETLVFIQDEKPVASLQMIPYQIKKGTKIYQAGYISGAMTHPDYRRKGLMENLLYVAFEEMKKSNFPLSFLIPQEEWLFGFYEKYGYHKAFPVHSINVNLSDYMSPANTRPVNNTDISILSGYEDIDNTSNEKYGTLFHAYHNYLFKHEKVVLKNKHQFNSILKDLFLDGGKVFIAGNIQGIAFVSPFKKKVLIKEVFFDNEEIKTTLFTAISNTFKLPGAKCLMRDKAADSHFSGMIKIIDKQQFTEELFTEDTYMSMMLD